MTGDQTHPLVNLTFRRAPPAGLICIVVLASPLLVLGTALALLLVAMA